MRRAFGEPGESRAERSGSARSSLGTVIVLVLATGCGLEPSSDAEAECVARSVDRTERAEQLVTARKALKLEDSSGVYPSPDGRRFVVDLAREKGEVEVIALHADGPPSTHAVPDPNREISYAAIASRGPTEFWAGLEEGRGVARFDFSIGDGEVVFSPTNDKIYEVAVSPDGAHVAWSGVSFGPAGARDYTGVHRRNGDEVIRYEYVPCSDTLRFADNEHLLLLGPADAEPEDQELWVWRIRDGQETQVPARCPGWSGPGYVARDGEVYFLGRSGDIRRYDLGSREQEVLAPPPSGQSWYLVGSPDGRLLAAAGSEGARIVSVDGSRDPVAISLDRPVAFDPASGLLIAHESGVGIPAIVDPDTGDVLGMIDYPEHEPGNNTMGAFFTCDGRYLAVVSLIDALVDLDLFDVTPPRG